MQPMCRYWTCSFYGRNNQAIGPRLSAFSPYFYILILFAKWQWKLRSKILKNICMNELLIKYYATCSDEQRFFGFFCETIFEGIE